MLEAVYSVNNLSSVKVGGVKSGGHVEDQNKKHINCDVVDINCLQRCGEWPLVVNSKVNNKFYSKNSIVGRCGGKGTCIQNTLSSTSNLINSDISDVFPIDVSTAQQLVLDRTQEKVTFNIEYDLRSAEVSQFSNLNKDYSHLNFELFLNCFLHQKQILNKDINFTVKGYDIVKSIHNKIIDLFNTGSSLGNAIGSFNKNNQSSNSNQGNQNFYNNQKTVNNGNSILVLNPGVIYHSSVFSNIQCSIAIDFTVHQPYRVERQQLNYYTISNSEIKIVKLYIEYYLPLVIFTKKSGGSNGGKNMHIKREFSNGPYFGGNYANYYNNSSFMPAANYYPNGGFNNFPNMNGYYNRPQMTIPQGSYIHNFPNHLNNNFYSPNKINNNKYDKITKTLNNANNYEFYPKQYNKYKSYNNFAPSNTNNDMGNLHITDYLTNNTQMGNSNSNSSLRNSNFLQSNMSANNIHFCNWHNFMTLTTPLIQESENTTVFSIFKEFERLSIFGLDCHFKTRENKETTSMTYYPSLSSLFLEFNKSEGNNIHNINKNGFYNNILGNRSVSNANCDLNSTLDCSFFSHTSHTSHTSTNEDGSAGYTIKNYFDFQEEAEVWNRDLLFDKVKEIFKSDADLEDITLADISAESYFAILWTEKDSINPYNFAGKGSINATGTSTRPSFLVFYRFKSCKKLSNSMQFVPVIGFISSAVGDEGFWFGGKNSTSNGAHVNAHVNDLYIQMNNKCYFNSFVNQAHRFVNYNKINDNIDYRLLTKT